MKSMTKIVALSALGAAAAGGLGFVALRKRRSAAKQQAIDAFDFTDLDEPVIVSEEVIVVTEAGPYEIDMELISPDDVTQR